MDVHGQTKAVNDQKPEPSIPEKGQEGCPGSLSKDTEKGLRVQLGRRGLTYHGKGQEPGYTPSTGRKEGGRGRGRKEISNKDRAEGVREKEEIRGKEGGNCEGRQACNSIAA